MTRRGILQPLDELDQEDRDRRKELRRKLFERFQLVQSKSRHGTFWGYIDEDNGHQEIVSEFRHVAERHIKELIARQEEQELLPHYHGAPVSTPA